EGNNHLLHSNKSPRRDKSCSQKEGTKSEARRAHNPCNFRCAIHLSCVALSTAAGIRFHRSICQSPSSTKSKRRRSSSLPTEAHTKSPKFMRFSPRTST